MMLPNYDDDDANTTTTSMTMVTTMRPVRAVHVVRVCMCACRRQESTFIFRYLLDKYIILLYIIFCDASESCYYSMCVYLSVYFSVN